MRNAAHTKYTFELLTFLVKTSSSYREVIEKLGLRVSGGNHSHIKRRVSDLKIDISHFMSGRLKFGERYKGRSGKLTKEVVLVKDRIPGRRENLATLRRVMAEHGFKEECTECGIPPSWNGKPLRLQIDHRNGDFCDNQVENLRFVCPNCHCQTETWGVNKSFYVTLKRKICASGEMADTEGLGPSVPKGQLRVQAPSRVPIKREQVVCRCGVKFSKKKSQIGFCSYKCSRSAREKTAWPSDEELKLLVGNQSILSIAKTLGVSGNAVTKRCRLRGIEVKSKWTLKKRND